MSAKSFAVAAGITFGTMVAIPVAVHNRDINFYPQDEYSISEEPDGPHMHVINSRMDTIASIHLTPNEKGELVGEGMVKGLDYKITVADPGKEEALFVHKHGGEKLWLGRDVVHVYPADPPADDNTPAPGF